MEGGHSRGMDGALEREWDGRRINNECVEERKQIEIRAELKEMIFGHVNGGALRKCLEYNGNVQIPQDATH